MRTSIILLLSLALWAGCGKQPEPSGAGATLPVAAPEPANQAASTNRQVFRVKGVVRELVSATRARIEHEEIPNYMPAMTMPLDVKNTNELAGLQIGEKIVFDMVVTEDDGWIEKIARVGETNLVAGATNQFPKFRRVRDVDQLSVGDAMPDYPFTTEEGNALKLSDLKGKAIALTFIFTRCPFPNFCPRMNTNFEKVGRELSKPGSPTNWHMLSISFDPEYDTPERLKQHARAKHPERDPAKWNFVTSELIEIDAITEQMGLMFANRNGTIDHNLRSIVIGADGKIQQMYVGNEWTVDEFVEEMKKAAALKPEAPAPK